MLENKQRPTQSTIFGFKDDFMFSSYALKANRAVVLASSLHSFSNHADRLEIDNIKTISIDFSDHNLIFLRSNKIIRGTKTETIQYQLINSKTNKFCAI